MINNEKKVFWRQKKRRKEKLQIYVDICGFAERKVWYKPHQASIEKAKIKEMQKLKMTSQKRQK